MLCTAAVGAAELPRNIILCYGSGMGKGAEDAARCWQGTPLVFEGFPHVVRMATDNAGGTTTDSAASGSAIAAGRKVNANVVSVALPGDGSPLETLLELCKRHGKKTGLVTTSFLTDASPAAFGAHAASRNDGDQIAACYLNGSRPDVLLGGGGNGLYAADAAAAGYTVVTDRAALLAADTGTVSRLCGLFGNGEMPYQADRPALLPTLSEMAGRALDFLGNAPDGFFLLVENEKIDSAARANDLPHCVQEVLELQTAVQTVLAWAQGRDDTLVLVMADHETGGLAVTQDNGPGNMPSAVWTTSGCTSGAVGLYGWGLNARCVQSVSDNIQVIDAVRGLRTEAFLLAGFERWGGDGSWPGAGQGSDNGNLYSNRLAQTFEPTTSGFLRSVALGATFYPSTTAPLRIRITDTTNGVPADTLATTFIPCADIPADSAVASTAFTATGRFDTVSLLLEAGHRYAIVLDTDEPEANYRFWKKNASYSGGRMFSSQNAHPWSLSSGVLCFRVEAKPPCLITSMKRNADGGVRLRWINANGAVQVERSPDLVDWDEAAAPQTAAPECEVPVNDAPGRVFFRLR
ncbi:MAG: alkaline phosphatase, partial [Verrucomicrobiota bacterium]|nr:alkaline phosphatase [Verrucomicrobiota bacterium]